MVDSLGQAVVAVENPLLQTKLYIPRSRTSVVPRPRLIGRLTHGAEGKLTLVSAPAGFGKTTRSIRATMSRRSSGPTSSPRYRR